MSDNEIEVSEESYLSLRKAYRKAVATKADQFIWRNIPVLTDYAKYLLEYMETLPIITDAVKAEDDPEDDE